MSLLDEILNDVISDDVNIPNILRKCLVLGFEIDHQVFIEWVGNELSGYNPNVILPHYRELPCHMLGNFIGYNLHMTSKPIDLACLHKSIRERYSKARIRQSISEVDSLSKDTNSKELGYPIIPSLLPLIDSPYGDSTCYQAWISISTSALVSIIDEVKNRILRTILQIKKEVPEASEIKLNKLDKTQTEIIKQIITNQFNTNVDGNANIANASENFNQNLQIQSNELIDRLVSELKQLKDQGNDGAVVDEIIPHIESIKQIKDKPSFMDRIVDVMTIAGGSASVVSVITPYIAQLKNLFA